MTIGGQPGRIGGVGRRHRLLLAAVFCVVAWATVALTTPRPADSQEAVASAAPCTPVDDPGTGTSDGQWHAGSRASAAITESLWKLSPVHADLAGARCGDLFETAPALPRRHCAFRRTPDHRPLRIPLLI